MTIHIMEISHREAGDFPLIAHLKAGDKLIADGGFTCVREGEIVTLEEDADGLFFRCCASEHGDYGAPADNTRTNRHGLDGQENASGQCVGLFIDPVQSLKDAARICINASDIGVAVPVGLLSAALRRFS